MKSPVNASTSTSRRRFIAGATCPACKKQDKLVVYVENEQKFFECVSCGHKEVEASTVKPTEPVPNPAKVNTGEQVLKFYPSPKKSS